MEKACLDVVRDRHKQGFVKIKVNIKIVNFLLPSVFKEDDPTFKNYLQVEDSQKVVEVNLDISDEEPGTKNSKVVI